MGIEVEITKEEWREILLTAIKVEIRRALDLFIQNYSGEATPEEIQAKKEELRKNLEDAKASYPIAAEVLDDIL